MDIKPNYNPESSIFTLEFRSDLVTDYFNNLRGMLLNYPELKNLDVVRMSSNTAKITFKISKEEISTISKPASISSMLEDTNIPDELKSELRNALNHGENMNLSVMTVRPDDTSNPIGRVNTVINKFISLALKDKIKTTEFLPIKNYPNEGLSEDVLNALQNKRNLCIIDDYNNYKSQMQTNTFEFNQCMVKYGTSDYADVVLMIVNSDFDEFKKYYSNKLKLTSWV